MKKEKYNITYKIEPYPDGIEADKIEGAGKNVGLCDKIFVMSIVSNPGGGQSYMTISLDGTTSQPMSEIEMFKAFVMLAGMFAEGETSDLFEWQKEMVIDVLDKCRTKMKELKELYNE